MNVIENVKYGLKYRGHNKEEQIKLAKEYLKIVGLEGYGKKLCGRTKWRTATKGCLS